MVVASRVSLPLLLPACSLVYDFSTFRTDGETDAAREEDGGSELDAAPELDARVQLDGGGELDASGPDAAAEVDASMGLDATTALDAGRMDAGIVAPTDAGRDAATVASTDAGRDAASLADASLTACSGLTSSASIDLGTITGLPSPILNTRYAVRAVGDQLALVWQDSSANVHLRAWRVDVATPTASPTIADLVVGSAAANASLGVGRDGSDWVVWAYPSTLTVRCPDGGSSCTPQPRPAEAASPYAFAQGPSTFAWVHSASTFPGDWRATALGSDSSIVLTDAGSHIVTPDAVATSGTGYVSILEDVSGDGERVVLAFFDTSAFTHRVVRSLLGRTNNSIYVTHDASTGTALGVAAVSTTTYLVVARETDAVASTPLTWTSSTPSPIVSRGDGTFYVRDHTSYSLRRVADVAAEIARPGDPGALGAAVVVDGHYAYFAFLDLSTDRLQLHLYDCP